MRALQTRNSTAPWSALAEALEAQRAVLRATSSRMRFDTTAFAATSRIAEQCAGLQRSWRDQLAPLRAALPSATSAVRLNGLLVAELERTARMAELGGVLKATFAAHERTIGQLIGPCLATSRLAAAIESMRESWSKSFEPLRSATLGLSSAASAVHEQLAGVIRFQGSVPDWRLRAPTLEPYLATRTLGVLSGAPWEVLQRETDSEAEAAISVIGDELEGRLAALGAEFAEPYRGAFAALDARGPDWCRHVSVSVRELMSALLNRFAPEDELRRFFNEPTAQQFANGRFTRRAQLQYAFRHVAVEGYAMMVEVDINTVLATFYPANDGVHALMPPLTEHQMKVFLRRIQGCLSTILEAAGH